MLNFGPSEFIFLSLLLICAVVAARVARAKGYSAALFAVLGFVFPVLTILVALILPRRTSAAPVTPA